MTYQGTQDAGPRSGQPRLDLRAAMTLLSMAEGLGVDYSGIEQVRAARRIAERTRQLEPALEAKIADAAEQMADRGREFAIETLTVEELVDAAAVTAKLTSDITREARRHLDHAGRAAAAVAMAGLTEVSEKQWLEPLRPHVEQAIAEANEHADALGIIEPRARQAGTRTSEHPWAPSRVDLERTTLRHEWERLGEALLHLDTLHGIADELRRHGLIPRVAGRDWCEDYRWLVASRLTGRPGEFREFWLANRHHAQPGLFTAAELETGHAPGQRGKGGDSLTPPREWAVA